MDIYAIAEALGVLPIVQGERAAFTLINRHTGVKIRLELNSTAGWLRLHADLKRKAPGRHIGTIMFERDVQAECFPVQQEIVFYSGHTALTIDSGGRFEVAVS